MANERTTVYVEGEVYWAKIVGDKALHDNYDGDAREWSYELVPNDTGFLKEHRLLDRLKDKDDPKNPDKGNYLVLRKPELNKDGEKNDPIAIYDHVDGKDIEWDNRLIGNGTKVVAKLSITDWGKGKKKSIYTQALRIVDLVPYESNAFGGYDSASESQKAKASNPKAKTANTKAKDAELDDLDDEDEISF